MTNAETLKTLKDEDLAIFLTKMFCSLVSVDQGLMLPFFSEWLNLPSETEQ